MGEERFRITTLPKSNVVVFDEKDKEYYIGIDLEDLLNKQQFIIDEQKIAIDEMITDYKNLKKENEDLRKQVESSETTSNATSNYNAFLESKITTLEQENGQLRQFINKGRRLSVKELMDNINENELLKKKIRGLEKENEQLRKNKAQLTERLRECSMRLDRFNCR